MASEENKGWFTIGTTLYFGSEQWQVVRYHKVGGSFEVMFCNLADGRHKSIPCSKLEALIDY